MIWLLVVGLLSLAAFTALGIEDSRHHRVLRTPDES